MAAEPAELRIAFVAWEPGRARSGHGTKIGGLGSVMEELPQEIARAAAKRGQTVALEVLSPCFGHYDRSKLTKLDYTVPAYLKGQRLEIEIYEKRIPFEVNSPNGPETHEIRLLFFWEDWQLNWTTETSIYPDDPWMALHLNAVMCQGFAGHLSRGSYHAVHLHDYHVGLTVFYLPAEAQARIPVHLTIHNATYQGTTPSAPGKGFTILDELGLPGATLFHKYFDFFDKLNLMKAAMIRVHELGGKITTVSGNLKGTWGYAAELRESHEAVRNRAAAQKGSAPWEFFHPNQGLDVFEKLPIAGITNGLSSANWPNRLPVLQAAKLQRMQENAGAHLPLFNHPAVQYAMLEKDHVYDENTLHTKSELKRLLHLEAFGYEPDWLRYPIFLVTIGRLVQQKNLGLIAEVFPDVLAEFPETRLFVLASAGDDVGRQEERQLHALRGRYPDRVFFRNDFNYPLSKLIMAGGDFALVPSRFEPCGLVDYEASLLGTVVIGRRTGGLAKVGECAYLYDWLDIGDRAGERWAFQSKIREAFRAYYDRPEHHGWLMRQAMRLDASWDRSAADYLDMYLYGLQSKDWKAARVAWREGFLQQLTSLAHDRFERFFMPAQREYGDRFDWEMRALLDQS